MLEAMQETRGDSCWSYPSASRSHSFVLATQNPIEQEGTYPLPEAQLDRFMFNIWVDYPCLQEEIDVVKSTTSGLTVDLSEIMHAEEILYYQGLVRRVPMADNVLEYAVKLASSTRPGEGNSNKLVNEFLSWGAGPRASQYLVLGAKCHALLQGKYSPDIEDVKAVALPILRHRNRSGITKLKQKVSMLIESSQSFLKWNFEKKFPSLPKG